MAQLIINWRAERQAQFIKCLRFFLQCIFLAIPGGGVPSTLQILTLDLQSRDLSIRHFQYGGVCLHFARASFNTVFNKSNFKITLIFSKMTLHFNYIV